MPQLVGIIAPKVKSQKKKKKRPPPGYSVPVQRRRPGERYKNPFPPRKKRPPKGKKGAFVSNMRDRRAGMRASFTGKNDAMSMDMHFKIGNLQVDAAAAGVSFGVTGGVSKDLPLSLVNSFYWPSWMTNLARLFDRFRVNRCHLSYEPRQSTAQTAAFTLASSVEPAWCEAHGAIAAGIALPSEAQLSGLHDACTAVCFDRCELEVPIDKSTGWLYSSAVTLTTATNYSTTTTADIRQSHAGVILVNGLAGGLGAGTVLGDLYVRLNVSFKEFSLAISSVVTLNSRNELVVERMSELKTHHVRSLASLFHNLLLENDVALHELERRSLTRDPYNEDKLVAKTAFEELDRNVLCIHCKCYHKISEYCDEPLKTKPKSTSLGKPRSLASEQGYEKV